MDDCTPSTSKAFNSEVITITEDSPESPEVILEVIKDDGVVRLDEAPDSPSAEDGEDIVFLKSTDHPSSSFSHKSMKVRVETEDDGDGQCGIGFSLDRVGLYLPNPLYDAEKVEKAAMMQKNVQIVQDSSIPVYDVLIEGPVTINIDSDDEERPGDICKASTNKNSGQKCFNCDGSHMINDCPLPKNMSKISKNVRQFRRNNTVKNCRYHEDNDQKYAQLKPGVLSEELRDTLGLRKNQLPRHIYNMRVHGYPPGWKQYAIEFQPTLKLYGGQITKLDVRSQSIESRLHDYPGFNTPVHPNEFVDESRSLYKPPYNPHYPKRLIQELTERRQEEKRKINQNLESHDGRRENYDRDSKRKGDDNLDPDYPLNKKFRYSSSTNANMNKPQSHNQHPLGRGQNLNFNRENDREFENPRSSRWGEGQDSVARDPHFPSSSDSSSWRRSERSYDNLEENRSNLRERENDSRGRDREANAGTSQSFRNQERRFERDGGNRNDERWENVQDEKGRRKGTSVKTLTDTIKYRFEGSSAQKWNEESLPAQVPSKGSPTKRNVSRRGLRSPSPSLLDGDAEILMDIPGESLTIKDDDIMVLSPAPGTSETAINGSRPIEIDLIDVSKEKSGQSRVDKLQEESGSFSSGSSPIIIQSDADDEISILSVSKGKDETSVAQLSPKSSNVAPIVCVDVDLEDNSVEMCVTTTTTVETSVKCTPDLHSEKIHSESTTIIEIDLDPESGDQCSSNNMLTTNLNDISIESKQLNDLPTANASGISEKPNDLESDDKTNTIDGLKKGDNGQIMNKSVADKVINGILPDVYIYKNNFEELPSMENFSENGKMGDLVLHETNEECKGRFDKVLKILKRRKNDSNK